MSNDTREALAANPRAVLEELVAIQDLRKSLAQANHHAVNFPSDENYAVIDSLSTELARRSKDAWAAARAALTEQPAAPQQADPDLMTIVEHILDAGHLNTEDLGRLRAAWERAVPAAAPQGDSVERCGSPSGAVSGGSGIGASEADDEFPTWVLLLRPGMAPQRKGPFHSDEFVASMVRDCARIYPDSTTVVLDGPVTMYPVSGKEWLCSRDPEDPDAMHREARDSRPSTGASVAGPEARPNQQSDSSAAPQGVQAEPPPGFVLVPKEPTPEMVVAMKEAWWVGGSTHCAKTADAYRVYAAMLAAAPAAPAQEPQQPAPHVRPLLDIATSLAEHLHQVQDWIEEHLAAAASSPAPVQPNQGGAYHAWCGNVEDEATLRLAASVCDDVLGDIAGWEDRALAEAVEATKSDLLAMADAIRAKDGRAAASSPAPAVQPCAKIFDHKWLDPECVESGCQSLVVAELVDVLKTVVAVHGLASAAIAKHGQPQGGK